MEKVFCEPAKIEVEVGIVRKIAPDGSTCAMTPEAAATTAVDMLTAAARAKGDRELAAEAERRERGATG